MDWREVAPGVWQTTIGTPHAVTPLAMAGGQPRLDALATLPAVGFPLDATAIAAETVGQRQVVTLPLGDDERVFGLGLQFMRLEQRGRTRHLRVNSDPRQDTGESHAPLPLYFSSRGYGVLVNTARIVTAHLASTNRRRTLSLATIKDRVADADWPATPPSPLVELTWAGEGADLLVFAGPSLLDAVRRQVLYVGGGVLPPRWGLGFWHRVNIKYRDEEVLAEAAEFRKRGYPCDVIGLEPGWHSCAYPCSFEWSEERFPDPTRLIDALAADGFRVNLWEHGYVAPKAALHAPLQPYAGSHTVWGGLVPDLTMPAAAQLLADQHDREHVARGVSGYKLDECDGSELTGCSWMFPAHATFPSGVDGEQMRQVLGLLLQRITSEVFRRHDRRTYGLVRASGPGASPLPYVLYSDLYDHREFVRALCNSSFSGLLWTPEVRTASSAEDWVRRMQAVIFSPLAMLNAWSSSTMPWSYPEVADLVRETLNLRMELLPYFYSAFARYWSDGVPPFRAMALELPPDSPHLGVDDQWLAGDHLLVAPLFAGQAEREVVLPPGRWFDFYTGQPAGGNEVIRVSPDLARIPVFVRDGGIVTTMPALPSAPRAGQPVPIVARYYGSAPGSFGLFDDDGETLAFERGAYRWIRLSVDARGNKRVTDHSPATSSYSTIIWQKVG